MVYCRIISCKSRSERKEENITFHAFPKDLVMRQSWILSTGRSNWDPKKYDRICSRHFSENCFRKTLHRVYLKESSISTLYVNKSVSDHKNTNCQTDMPIASTSAVLHEEDTSKADIEMECETYSCEIIPYATSPTNEIITYTPRKRKLLRKLKLKTLLAEKRKKKVSVLKSRNLRLKKKNADLSSILKALQEKILINQETADILTAISPQNKRFLKVTQNKFSPEVRKFALNLHFISPRAYDFVRNNFNTILPHARTLARWYQHIAGEPGFSSESLEALKLLAKRKYPQRWICGLSFDEMAIRKAVEWNGRNYVGFVNYGYQLENDDLPIAKEALVFMLTCLNSSWKLPVGYFLVDGTTSEQKASLVKTCVDLVSECGVEVVSVTFDGCAANFSMAKLLGCKLDGDLNPVFEHKFKKIVIFPDPSHMLKLVRNTLGEKTSLIIDDNIISWKYIQSLVELQENEGFHLANKIRSAHINYKKQIMKVKLAAQLFSESVADSIEFCEKELRLAEFKNCAATVEFIRNINALFDVLNTRNLNSYGYKKPLMPSNFERIKVFLNDVFQYIKSLKLEGINILNSSRKTGFLGLLLCIKAVLFLYDTLVTTNKIDFLSSYKLSQDHLEIFFSAIRAKGGFNNNPTATQFKSAFKRILIHGELKHLVSGNCVPLCDINILSYSHPILAINKTTDRNRLTEQCEELKENSQPEVVPNDHDYLGDPTRLTEFSRQVIIYIAGFIIKAMESQIKCQQCLASLYSTNKIESSLQYKKDKGGLRYPSRDLIKLCFVAEDIHRKTILSKKYGINQLLQECLKKCVGLNLFSEVSHDISNAIHHPLLIKAICKKYLNLRIHYATKSMIKENSIRNFYTKLILFKGH